MVDDDEAIKRAVRAFYEGAGFPEYEKATGKPIKYSKDFFDSYEKDLSKSIKKFSKSKKEDEPEESDNNEEEESE